MRKRFTRLYALEKRRFSPIIFLDNIYTRTRVLLAVRAVFPALYLLILAMERDFSVYKHETVLEHF